MPNGFQFIRPIPACKRNIVAMVHQTIRQCENGISMHVEEQRSVRRREIDTSVGFGEFLQFPADMSLPMAPDVLMMGDVESGEVEVTLWTRHVEAG